MRKRLTGIFLSAGLVTGCASLAPPTSIPSSQAAPSVKQAIDAIEDTLAGDPNIAQVIRCDTPGAKRVFVHLHQSHFLEPGFIDTSTPEGAQELERKRQRYRVLNDVQHRVHNTLLRIVEVTGTHSIMLEGLTEVPVLENVAREYYRILDTLDRHKRISAPAPEEKTATYADINDELLSRFPADAPLWSTYGFIPGAAYLLALNRRIELLPADTAKSERRAYAARAEAEANKDPHLGMDRVEIMDDREDAVLQRATEVPAPVSIVIYGLGHAFGGKRTCGEAYTDPRKSYRDNIAEWNDHHPDDKFSLLEITVHGISPKEKLPSKP